MRKKIFVLFLLLVFVVTAGAGCSSKSNQPVQQDLQPITLNYWRVWDGPDDFRPIIDAYNKSQPNITINYRKLGYDEYEAALLDAWAEDRGPDIFSIQNTWIRKYQTKIAPMPDSITMVRPALKGTFKKEVVGEVQSKKSISLSEIKQNFVDTVAPDVIISSEGKEKVYGLPLFIDTLAMYYNKDLLNNAGIPELSAYWNQDFQQQVKKLTKQDVRGELIQSGVALGGSKNIERSSDILSALMMQNGAIMMEGNAVTFNKIPASFRDREGYNPGIDAIRFYSDFANPAKEVYSWNSSLDNSLQHFINGKLGIFFGYSYHLPMIQSQAPKLNFGIAKFPQIEGNPTEANTANYWVETASAKTKYPNEAWDFIQFMTTKPEQAKLYLDSVHKPTALRTLLKDQLLDDSLKIFASQVLTARNWYRGKDVISAEGAMNEMIDAVITNTEDIESVVNLAVNRIQQTIGR
jgi:ABC-type glycerol-3-phosphate transport system substrate-binding protein